MRTLIPATGRQVWLHRPVDAPDPPACHPGLQRRLSALHRGPAAALDTVVLPDRKQTGLQERRSPRDG